MSSSKESTRSTLNPSSLVCFLGSLVAALAVVFFPWNLFGQMVTPTPGLVNVVAYPFFFLASLATWSLKLSSFLVLAPFLLGFCVLSKSSRADDHIEAPSPRSSWKTRVLYGAGTLWVVWSFVLFCAAANLSFRTRDAGPAADPQSVYTRLLLNKPTGATSQGRWVYRVEDELRYSGVFTDTYSRGTCRFLAQHSQSTWIRVTINGRAADVSLCRFGPNTITWTAMEPIRSQAP